MDTREIIMPTGGFGNGFGNGCGNNNNGDGLFGGGGIGALLIGSMLFGGNRGGFGGNGGYGNGYGGYGNPGVVATAATSAVADSIVLNPAFQSLQHQIDGIEGTLNAHNIDAGITSVNQNVSNTSRDQLNSIANLSTAQATSAFTTLTSINGLGRDITASQTQALINQLQNFNTLQGNVTNSTNLIIAGQNAQNATQAACCCDIKQLIQSDGNLTRALINDTNLQNLRDQLAVSQNKVSNNEQNQYLLHTILEHVKPIVPAVF